MGKACADHQVHFTISRWIGAMLSSRTELRCELNNDGPLRLSAGWCFVTAFVEYGY
jgi:hypothetical protein